MTAPCPSLGFVVAIRPDPLAAGTLVDDLVSFLENHALTAQNASDRPFEIVVHREGAQTTEQDRTLVLGWAADRISAAAITVGPVVDLR